MLYLENLKIARTVQNRRAYLDSLILEHHNVIDPLTQSRKLGTPFLLRNTKFCFIFSYRIPEVEFFNNKKLISRDSANENNIPPYERQNVMYIALTTAYLASAVRSLTGSNFNFWKMSCNLSGECCMEVCDGCIRVS